MNVIKTAKVLGLSFLCTTGFLGCGDCSGSTASTVNGNPDSAATDAGTELQLGTNPNVIIHELSDPE